MPNADCLLARSLEEIRQLVNAKAATPNRRFGFEKRRQLFIGAHNEMVPVISRNSGYRHMPRRVEKHGIAARPGWLPYSRSQIPWIPRN